MLCKRVVTKDRRYITQITCYEKGNKVGTGELTLLTNDKAPFVPMSNKIISTTRHPCPRRETEDPTLARPPRPARP